jgi:hypothetical protein|tara:strand:- start:2875 stop:3120 length:246 start_codon:yes stop_codon:yes gene_type:complete
MKFKLFITTLAILAAFGYFLLGKNSNDVRIIDAAGYYVKSFLNRQSVMFRPVVELDFINDTTNIYDELRPERTEGFSDEGS